MVIEINSLGAQTSAAGPGADTKIRPTVYIGLGGSGRRVVMMLRKLLFEQFNTSSLPFTEFLCFDTDAGGVLSNVDSWMLEQIQLTDQEMLTGALTESVMQHYYNNLDVYPHIFHRSGQRTPHAWFDYDQLKGINTGAVDSGAGQIRPFGRLAFFHHYGEIRRRLESIKVRLTSDNVQKEAGKFGFGQHLDLSKREIVIISSLAGGTGSGCFLDVAYLAKHIFKDDMVTGIFFLPSVFDSKPGVADEVLKANGFAALRELEYYSSDMVLKRHDQRFTFCWDRKEPLTLMGAPFKCVYLLDDRNMVGTRFGTEDVFQMTADYLALHIDKGGLGEQRRSDRANTLAKADKKWEHHVSGDGVSYVEYLPMHYFTFGLAQIRLDQAKTANAAANRLGTMLIENWWLNANPIEPNFVNEGLKHLVMRLHLGWEDVRKNLLDVIPLEKRYPPTDESVQKLRISAQALCDDFRKNPDKPLEKMDAGLGELNIAFGSFLRDSRIAIEKQLAADSRQHGDRLAMSRQASKLKVQICENLLATFLDYLANPRVQGHLYAVQVRSELATVLTNARIAVNTRRQQLEEAIQSFEASVTMPMPAVERLHQIRKLALEAQGLFPFTPLAPGSKAWAVRLLEDRLRRARLGLLNQMMEEVERVLMQKRQALMTYADQCYELEALKLMASPGNTGVLDVVLDYLGDAGRVASGDADKDAQVELTGLNHGLLLYQDRLLRANEQFLTRHEAFSRNDGKPGRDILLSAKMDYTTELLAFFRKRLNIEENSDVLEALTTKFFAEAGIVSGTALDSEVVDVSREGVRQLYSRSLSYNQNAFLWNEVLRRLETFVYEQTREFKRDANVWELFQQQPDVEQGICNVLSAASPRLALKKEYGGNPPPEQKPLLGQPKNMGKFPLNVATTHFYNNVDKPREMSSDRIVLATEWALFPLNNVDGLEELERAYNHQALDDEASSLMARRHTLLNRDVLPNVMLPDSDTALKRLGIFQALVKGLVVGTLKVDATSGAILLLEERAGLLNSIPLGTTLSAATMLLERRAAVRLDWLNQIHQANDLAVRQLLYSADSLWNYALLLGYLVKEVFPDETMGSARKKGNHFHPLFWKMYLDHRDLIMQNMGLTEREFAQQLRDLETTERLQQASFELALQGDELFAPLRVLRG